jgi:hypothetical protein
MKSSTSMDRDTAPEKKGSRHNPQHDGWPIHGSVPSFSPELAIKAVGVKPPSIDGRLLGLPGPYHRHTIGTFNNCLRGPTHRSLTDTGRGYSHEGADFPQTTPRPSQPIVFTFYLRALPSLQFNHNQSKVPKFKFREPMAAMWSSDHLAIYRGIQLCLAITNDLSPVIGSTRKD